MCAAPAKSRRRWCAAVAVARSITARRNISGERCWVALTRCEVNATNSAEKSNVSPHLPAPLHLRGSEMSDEFGDCELNLIVRFVVCKSNGGTLDDVAFVAGIHYRSEARR